MGAWVASAGFLNRGDVRECSDIYKSALVEALEKTGLMTLEKPLSEEQFCEVLSDALNSNKPLLLPEDGSPHLKKTAAHLKVLKELLEADPTTVPYSLISNAREASDVLAVMLLQKMAGVPPVPVVPLFETLDDLKKAPQVMEKLLSVPYYRELVEGSFNGRVDVMLGYSDSSKGVGYLAANVQIGQAIAAIHRICKESNLELQLYHGRGSPPRGGDPSFEITKSMGELSGRGGIVTLQGQSIFLLTMMAEQAQRFFEKGIIAGIYGLRKAADNNGNGSPPPGDPALSATLHPLLERVVGECSEAHQQMNASAAGWLKHTTAAGQGFLPLGSRSAHRPPTDDSQTQRQEDLSSLRAISYVTKFLNNGSNLFFYGLGTVLESFEQDKKLVEFKELVDSSPWLRQLLVNVGEMVLRSDPTITQIWCGNPGESDSTGEIANFQQSYVKELAKTRKYLAIVLDDQHLGASPLTRQLIESERGPQTATALLQMAVSQAYRAGHLPDKIKAELLELSFALAAAQANFRPASA